MTMWNREEFWHGEALAAVLAMHDVTVDYDVLKANRLKLGWKDRLDPIKQSRHGVPRRRGLRGRAHVVGRGERVVGDHGVPAHGGARGASGARRTAAPHRQAGGAARRLLHLAGARAPRGELKKARKITRFALSRFWAPVGSSINTTADVRHVMTHLMSGPDGRRAARKVDDSISGMPGLGGLTIVQDALDELGIPA